MKIHIVFLVFVIAIIATVVMSPLYPGWTATQDFAYPPQWTVVIAGLAGIEIAMWLVIKVKQLLDFLFPS